MSKSTQASRSHPEDSRGEHSKASQKPTPAHSSVRESIDVDEAKGGVKKVHRVPAHLTHFHDLQDEHKETLREGAFPNRKAGVAREVAGAAARARRELRGKLVHADGSSDATSGKKVARIG